MDLSFTGQFHDVSFSPPIESFTHGTVLGLAFAYVDIRSTFGDASGVYNGGITVPASGSIGPNSNASGTSGYGVRGGWRLGGNVANGTIAPNGFQYISPGQFPGDGPSTNTTNPISGLERLGWGPSSFAVRFQSFSVMPAAGTNPSPIGLILDLDGGTTLGVAYIPTTAIFFGSTAVSIGIPAPAATAPLLAAALFASRRHRRSCGR